MADLLQLAQQLSESRILRDYEHAFCDATGLPFKFQLAGQKRAAMRGSRKANPFCVQLAETEAGCKICVEAQERLSAAAATTYSNVCLAGLTDSAVPVKLAERVLGFLQTGQVALKNLRRADFQRVTKFLQNGGADIDWTTLEQAYFDTRTISRPQYEAVLRLLEVFAQHLSLAAEQIATQQQHAEPPLVVQAREVIDARHGEDLTLAEVARAVHTSTFHFCKVFKKATGLTFTQYLSIVRVAKAKKALANPQARISEVAYEAGFASLTHFNRMFKRIAGQSPTEYRERVVRGLRGVDG